jgi:hypothetical protein
MALTTNIMRQIAAWCATSEELAGIIGLFTSPNIVNW